LNTSLVALTIVGRGTIYTGVVITNLPIWTDGRTKAVGGTKLTISAIVGVLTKANGFDLIGAIRTVITFNCDCNAVLFCAGDKIHVNARAVAFTVNDYSFGGFPTDCRVFTSYSALGNVR